MSVIIDGTSGITFPNSSTQASAGKVLQIANTTSTAIFSTTSGTFVSTGVSVSITPKFNTSKILILLSSQSMYQTGDKYPNITVYRDSTPLNSYPGIAGSYTQTYASVVPVGSVYLDSPATTTSTSYTIYFANINGNGNVIFNNSGGQVSLIVMEIAA